MEKLPPVSRLARLHITVYDDAAVFYLFLRGYYLELHPKDAFLTFDAFVRAWNDVLDEVRLYVNSGFLPENVCVALVLNDLSGVLSDAVSGPRRVQYRVDLYDDLSHECLVHALNSTQLCAQLPY